MNRTPGPTAEPDVVVWYNPRCSKCRGAEELLAACGVPAQRMFYLDNPPARDEITRVLALLGTADPRALMRTGRSSRVPRNFSCRCSKPAPTRPRRDPRTGA
jgi:arsenate reductase-like glutaredoxin family protein